MRKWVIAVLCLLTLAACGGNDSTPDGDNPFLPNSGNPTVPGGIEEPEDPGDPRLARMALSASQYAVKTDDSDTATVTVTALDENNAALEGVAISLRTSAGMLNTAQLVTGPDGTATFTLRAGPEKTNQVATVTATSGEAVKTVPILITGTTLSLDVPKTSVLQHEIQGVVLSGQVLDAAGRPLFGEEVALSSSLGNTLAATDPLGRPLSGPSVVLTTSMNGQFQATYSGDILGQDTVTLKSCGVQKSVSLMVKDTRFGFVQPAQEISVPEGATVDLLVQWEDGNGPVVGEEIMFAASHGRFMGESALGTIHASTDSQGLATVRYIASDLATPATIQISTASGLEDHLQLNILAENPNRLDVQAFPTVIPPSIGEVASTSTIVATVRDLSNNPVQGALVDFRLLDGAEGGAAPGGGESLFPLFAYTDASGQAATTFTAGSLTSSQNGIKVRAVANGFSGEVEITVGQKAARLVLGTSNRLEVIERDGIEVAYGMPVTVLVTDNNGNPIPEQKISLGLHPVRFKSGYWVRITDEEILGEDPPHSEAVITGVFANEDRNRNGILDAGEDTIVPNGRLDPGNVASIPAEVVTDEYGLAMFKVVYAKSYAVWVDVELTAATTVTGSEAKARIEETLPWLADENGFPEEPVIHSPFGF